MYLNAKKLLAGKDVPIVSESLSIVSRKDDPDSGPNFDSNDKEQQRICNGKRSTATFI